MKWPKFGVFSISDREAMVLRFLPEEVLIDFLVFLLDIYREVTVHVLMFGLHLEMVALGGYRCETRSPPDPRTIPADTTRHSV